MDIRLNLKELEQVKFFSKIFKEENQEIEKKAILVYDNNLILLNDCKIIRIKVNFKFKKEHIYEVTDEMIEYLDKATTIYFIKDDIFIENCEDKNKKGLKFYPLNNKENKIFSTNFLIENIEKSIERFEKPLNMEFIENYDIVDRIDFKMLKAVQFYYSDDLVRYISLDKGYTIISEPNQNSKIILKLFNHNGKINLENEKSFRILNCCLSFFDLELWIKYLEKEGIKKFNFFVSKIVPVFSPFGFELDNILFLTTTLRPNFD